MPRALVVSALVSVAWTVAPGVAEAKKAPVVLENQAGHPLAVGTETINWVGVYWGHRGNSEQCDFERNGSLSVNSRPALTELFNGQGHERCYLKEVSASGVLYSAKYSDKGTVTWYAKPAFTIMLAGCTYRAAKIVMTLPVNSDHAAGGETTEPGASFKLDKKLSGSACSATSDFFARSAFYYQQPGTEWEYPWAKIEY